MPLRFENPVTSRIIGFLSEIGLEVRAGAVPAATILPGIHIERGALIIDEARLMYPGDLLHEAGHLAVLPAKQRNRQGADTGDDGGGEMAAIAWSYAAALHLGLDPAVVFHEAGYRGGANAMLENFRAGRWIGVPYLRWIGLTADDYPRMRQWLAG